MKTETVLKQLCNTALIVLFAAAVCNAADVKQSAYPTKSFPVLGDRALIVDSADGNKTKNVQLGTLPISTATQTALDLKSNISCFVNSSAFNACFGLDWPTGFDVAGNYTVTGVWDFTGATVTGLSGGSMTWPASDSAYYGVRNGAWVNLSGIFAAPLGSDDNYVTDAEKTTWNAKQNALVAGTDYLAPNGSAANLTSFPTLNQNTTGTSAGLSAQYIDWNATTGGSSIGNKPSTSPLTASMITGVFPAGSGAMCKDGTVGDCGIVTGTGNLTEFVGQTAWRLFYSDGSGDIQELALGASGTVLKSNGTSSAPTFQADNTSAGAGYVSTPPTYSDETCTAGQYALSESYRYDCVASGNWNRTALTDWTNLTPVAPTLTSRVISANGTTLTLTGSASLSVGAGGSGGFDVDCTTAGSGITATYASGAPGTNIVYTLGSTISSGDTCDLDYTQPGNGIEGTTGGADLASITSAAVTNNSTQVASNADTFTGTDGTALATHNANWANVGTDFLVANAVINSNHVRSTGTYNLFGGRYTASNSDTSVITLVGGATSSEDNTMPVVRASATLSGYGCYFSASASGNFTAVRFRKNGAYLADGNSGTWAMASDHVMKIVASGTSPVSLSCYIDGVLVDTATDSSSPIASGNPGFTGYPDGNLAKSTFDNWSDQ